MKVRLLRFCSVLAIVASVLLCFVSDLSAQERESRKSDYVVLGNNTNKTEVHLLLSQTLLIVLPVQMGTGYSWQVVRARLPIGTVEKLDSVGIQKLTKEGILEAPSGENIPGSTERQVFRLKPTTKGTSRLEFHYVRPWEPSKPEKRFFVTLSVASSSTIDN